MQQPLTTPPTASAVNEMAGNSASQQHKKPPLLARSLELMKPVTWFGPTWALLCGTIASGATSWTVPDVGRIALAMLMAGPILCGLSQVINDYYDRDIDAINEPDRLIPSGRISTTQVFITMLVLAISGVGIALYLGGAVATFVIIGLVLAVLYSAPPVRAKRNGWLGNSFVAISYEGLAWMAGHAVFAPLTSASVLIALLYSFGTHGIMSINDYKSLEGDRAAGIRTIPVQYGPQRAAWLIVFTMNVAQLGVIIAFLSWGAPLFAAIIGALLLVQIPYQRKLIQQPVENHLKFSAVGVSFFVWGMMVSAIGLRFIS